jgi:hypothetical protein
MYGTSPAQVKIIPRLTLGEEGQEDMKPALQQLVSDSSAIKATISLTKTIKSPSRT